MVRVVSCHHFLSQDVFLSQNEPVAFCCAQGKLLVATTQHAVNVHDLESRGNVLHSFPTVDLVKQIIYCESGNYVATIESKASWHRSLVTYVRIYFKWWIDVNGQPLKVRVAGCTPPSTDSQSWSKMFEMVELPLDKTPICISCCSKTSAIAVSLGNTISVFSYSVKVEPTSKHVFHDFDHFVDIGMPILVQDLKMCENYFACMSDNAVHVFKIIGEKNVDNEENLKISRKIESDLNSDSDLYDKNFVEWRFESCTNSGNSDTKWDEHIESKLHPNSFPINIHLRAVDKENEKFSSKEECEIFGPLLTVRGCTVELRLDSKVFEIFPMITSNINAITLLFRQFAPKDNKVTLTGLQLVPMYISDHSPTDFNDPLNAAASALEKCTFSLPWPNLNPSSSSCLKATGCFFSTPQEGFLYDVSFKTRLVNSYTYTATLKEVVVETALLHALTETGLETYTVHLPLSALHYIENLDGIKNILPSFDDAVCLLGLRPFLGVDHLVMSENHVILVSSVEDSVSNNETENANRSTLYSLKKATPVQVFMDLLEAGETHKGASTSMYYNLLSAAHMILRTQLLCNGTKNPETETLYKKSCLLLADYFVCSDSEQFHAVPYYHLSRLGPEGVIQRILELSHQNKHINIMKPLVHYSNSLLLDVDSQIKYAFSQAICEVILSAYTEDAPEMLWKIVLCSDLTGYKIDKLILTLKRRLTSKRHPLSPISNAADTTALVYLLLQKGNNEAAQNMLLSLSKSDLVTVLNNIHSRLWNGKNLSVFGKFIKETRPDAFIELLLSYIDNKQMNVPEIIQLLQNEAPNFDLHCVPLLKEFLEALLSDKKILSQIDSSVLILLVKIYLKRLLEPPDKSHQSSSMFSGNMVSLTTLFGSRPAWLNEMPPFNGKGVSRTCILSPGDTNRTNCSDSSTCCCWTCNEDLLRLQSLLSHLGPSEEVKGLVLDFLCTAKDNKTNWLSLEVMCSHEAQAIKILIGTSPKALLPYSKDTIGTDEIKWCMLFKLLHEHMIGLPEDYHLLEEYSQTFHGVLAHLAETLKPVELLGLLPPEENPLFTPHLKRCVEKHQADQLKHKIISLGQEIKSMMLY